jgi:co-chaperonin GroES (HSP10)
MFVRDITPVDEVTLRAEKIGIQAVVAEENQPRPSMAVIINLGPSPLLHEEFTVGDIVMFRTHAGGTFMEAGYEYRYLQHHEIIGSRSPDDGLDDLLPPNITNEMIQWANDLKRTLDVVAARQPLMPITTKSLSIDSHLGAVEKS